MMVYLKGEDVSSACGIKIGSTIKDLKDSYGLPVKVFAVTGGSYVVYDKKSAGSALHDGVVFFLDNSNHVKNWFSYMKFRG